MATTRTRRQYVPVRIGPGAVAQVEQLAAAQGVTRSAMLRTLLRLGLEAWRAGRR